MIRVRNRNKQHSKWLDAKSLAGAAGRILRSLRAAGRGMLLGDVGRFLGGTVHQIHVVTSKNGGKWGQNGWRRMILYFADL